MARHTAASPLNACSEMMEQRAERYQQQGLPEPIDGPDAEVDAVIDHPWAPVDWTWL